MSAPLPPNVHIASHPLLKHKVSVLRDRSTTSQVFREEMNTIAVLLGVEALSDLAVGVSGKVRCGNEYFA
jgi:uracil phosphoribosyltransferase